MPEGEELTEGMEEEILRYSESEIRKTVQNVVYINKEMTNVNDTNKVAEMINDVSKGMEKVDDANKEEGITSFKKK
jgi:hypothetical protein